MSVFSDQRITRLLEHGIVDLHFDLPMHLYEERHRTHILATEFLPTFKAGGIGVIVAAIYLEDPYLSGQAKQVALSQVACLKDEVERCPDFAICKSYCEIAHARAADKIAVIVGMEGAEPIGTDLDLLNEFYARGLRLIGLTHSRRNAAATGAAFVANGSSSDGLTAFGRDLVRESERLGIVIDLAHINSAGFNEILAITTKPPIISHSNARRFYDIDRNSTDEQIRAVGERGGIVGVNSILVSPHKHEATIERFIDHIDHVIQLIGIEGVGIGFDFFEFIYRGWPEEVRAAFHEKFPRVHFIPGLTSHEHALNLIGKLIDRGFSDEEMEKILWRNAARVFEQLL